MLSSLGNRNPFADVTGNVLQPCAAFTKLEHFASVPSCSAVDAVEVSADAATLVYYGSMADGVGPAGHISVLDRSDVAADAFAISPTLAHLVLAHFSATVDDAEPTDFRLLEHLGATADAVEPFVTATAHAPVDAAFAPS